MSTWTPETLAATLDFIGEYEDKVEEAAQALQREIARAGAAKPVVALTLGSGLDDVAELISDGATIAYSAIPSFPIPKAQGHAGLFKVGLLEGVPVVGLRGRTHYYDVADEPLNAGILKVVFPIHVLANMGVSMYFATNAAGGLKLSREGPVPLYNPGDLMIIESHIHGASIPNPLMGEHRKFDRIDGGDTSRFQPMNDAYSRELTELMASAANGLRVWRGTYASTSGPTYESSAESRMLRMMGADAVGMSTTPEVIVARNRGLECAGFSCITNVIDANGVNATSHAEVLAALKDQSTRERINHICREFFKMYAQRYT